MKKRFVLLIPFISLAMTSCSMSFGNTPSSSEKTQVSYLDFTQEDLDTMIAQVISHSKEIDEYSFEFKRTRQEMMTDSEKESQIHTEIYQKSLKKNGDVCYGEKDYIDNAMNYHQELYRAANDQYEEVTCYLYENFDDDNKPTGFDIDSCVKKNNPIYDFQADFDDEEMYVNELMIACLEPERFTKEKFDELCKEYEENGYAVTLAAKGNVKAGHLIIESTTTVADENKINKQYQFINANEKLVYENFRFVSFISENNYEGGGKDTFEASASYNNISISLPKDWDKSIKEPGLTDYPANAINEFLSQHSITATVPTFSATGAAYDYYTQTYNGYMDAFYLRVHNVNVNTVFTQFCALFSGLNYDSYVSAQNGNTWETVGMGYRLQDQHFEIDVHKGDYITVSFYAYD